MVPGATAQNRSPEKKSPGLGCIAGSVLRLGGGHDELDAGIFEFLLGELLRIFENNAKGQIIFTSHNLRALEMMDKNSLVFSTTNPKNRYIRFQNVKNNNNLRDLYLRAITLGGQKEEIYAETDSVEINRALRRAGKAGANGKK